MYIVIRGPQVHQSLTGEFDLYARAERRNVLPQLNVHLHCVWYCFTTALQSTGCLVNTLCVIKDLNIIMYIS